MSDRLDGQQSGRDPSGRFTSGNAGGPGRPRRITERAYLQTMSEACPPDVWREIIAKAVEQAQAGDSKSREWLASYLLGRPETAASSLHKIAVVDAAGSDPVESEATLHRLMHG